VTQHSTTKKKTRNTKTTEKQTGREKHKDTLKKNKINVKTKQT